MALYMGTRSEARKLVALRLQGAHFSQVEVERALRRFVVVGDRAALLLGLDTVPGIFRVSIDDHGCEHAQLEPGCVVVDIRGDCELEDVRDAIEEFRAEGSLVVPILRPVRMRDRLLAWWRWHWWSLWRR